MPAPAASIPKPDRDSRSIAEPLGRLQETAGDDVEGVRRRHRLAGPITGPIVGVVVVLARAVRAGGAPATGRGRPEIVLVRRRPGDSGDCRWIMTLWINK